MRLIYKFLSVFLKYLYGLVNRNKLIFNSKPNTAIQVHEERNVILVVHRFKIICEPHAVDF